MVSAGLSTAEKVNTVCNAKYFAEQDRLREYFIRRRICETLNAHLRGAACGGLQGELPSLIRPVKLASYICNPFNFAQWF